MSNTQMTNAEAFFPHDSKYQVCDADFCRQLERELNAANAKIKWLEEAGDEMADLLEGRAVTWTKAKEDKP